jgi:membrane-associated protease RseP (regulator of RpoE activity)
VKRLLVFGLLFSSILIGMGGMASAQMMKIQKRDAGTSNKGWLGVSIQDITSEMKKAMDLKSRDGVLVSEVMKKSPADSGGLKEKDVIVQFGSQSISDASELQDAVADTKPGTKVPVTVLRKGEKKTLDVVVGKQKTSRVFVSSSRGPFKHFEVFTGGSNTQGMSLRQLNDQLSKYFDVPEGNGVLVWEVGKGSPAEKAGINAGDVITVIGKKKIKQLRDVSRALGIFDDGEKAEIELLRKGIRKTVTLDVEEGNEGEGFQYEFDGPFRGHGENMFFSTPELDIQVPRIDVEAVQPDLDHLKIEMNALRERLGHNSLQMRENASRLKERSRELREEIEREVRPSIDAHVSHTI